MLLNQPVNKDAIVIEGGLPNKPSKIVAIDSPGQAATGTPEQVSESDELVQELFDGNLMFINGCFMTYRYGRWVAINNEMEVSSEVAKYYGFDLKKREINEIVGQLKLRYFAVAMPAPAPKLICMTNGVLDPMTGALRDHSPAYYMRNMVDVEWDVAATSPTWDKFMNDVFRDDEDKDQKIKFIQQWFGYCLSPVANMQKMLMLIGDGENGKSVLLKILSQVVGTDNTSNTQVERFGKKEVRAELEGKMLNISPELSDRAWQHDSYLKAIVTGDNIEARRLYKDSYSFVPKVRLVVSTNNLPKVYDRSHGFFRRIIILKFNRRFTDADRNRQIENDLLAELPGIFAWAVRGLQDLLQKGEFDIPVSSNAAIEDYKVESDDVKMFLAERMVIDPSVTGLLPPIVYAAYCKWAKDSGLTALNKITFGKRFKLAGASQRHTRYGDVWLVRLKDGPTANVVPLLPVLAAEQKAA